MSLIRPDRVPVMCQPSWGHILLNTGIDPVELWHEPEAYARGLLWVAQTYGFDGILMSVNGFEPDWERRVERMATSGAGITTIHWASGAKTSYPPDDLPVGRDHYQPIDDFAGFDPETVPAEIPEYLPVTQGLRFPVSRDAGQRQALTRRLATQTQGQLSLHGEVYSPLDYTLDLFGLEAALMNLLLDGARCHAILERFCEGNVKYALELVAAGCDAIKISSPYAGQRFLSQAMYREFVLPYEGRIARAVRAAGAAVYIHTCGAIGDRLELMREAGFSGLECLDPPPLGNTELEEAVGRIGDTMFIKGNVDSVNTLLRQNAAACKRDALERLRIGKRAKGYILSTACSIAPRVPAENVAVLAQAAAEAGGY